MWDVIEVVLDRKLLVIYMCIFILISIDIWMCLFLIIVGRLIVLKLFCYERNKGFKGCRDIFKNFYVGFI